MNSKDHCGVSPLHWACWHADVDSIEILLENQGNVFSRDITGLDALENIIIFSSRFLFL